MTPISDPAITERVREVLPSARADLERLVRIRSVSADPEAAAQVWASAGEVAALLRGAGLPVVDVVTAGDSRPAVLGSRPGPAGAPHVLLYAHHDVQPPGNPADWDSDPFEPVERDGRLFGRGTADDKAGVAVHLAALRSFPEGLPVGVTVLVEGEEEIGSPALPDFLSAYADRLRADVVVFADAGNWSLDVPVPGLVRGTSASPELAEAQFRAEAGLLDGVRLTGTGRLADRLSAAPALAVIGIDAPPVAGAANTIVPVARAKVSLRVAPGDDAEAARDALAAYLLARAPWGAQVRVEAGRAAAPFTARTGGRAYQLARSALETAWGASAVLAGAGGSIPFVTAYAGLFPDAEILITGVEDPDTRAHGANESLHLPTFERACLAEALLLRNLGEDG